MNAFLSLLEKHNDQNCLRRSVLSTLQVNMGNVCNQSCVHCHIDASPKGEKVMSLKVVNDILAFLAGYKIKTLDITGGAPELNCNFKYLIEKARSLVDEIIVRSNLTVIFESGQEYLPKFYKKNKVHLICSLPCYLGENVDRQRGDGVFGKSIEALKGFNAVGYSFDRKLNLDLVYNPSGANLPPDQKTLEAQYKEQLNRNHGISFNRLITITNVPIKRFKDYLKENGKYNEYFKLLKNNFNPQVLDNLMCRTFLSIGYNGKTYDCDFNQALGLYIKDKKDHALVIGRVKPEELENLKIIIGEHCLSCTAGCGSGCQGALTKDTQDSAIKESVKEYYGKILKAKNDLKTSVCCISEFLPHGHKEILSNIEPEILSKFYGCGSPIPEDIKGCRVLDLGSGTGRDTYLLSSLVGQEGFVTGIDMTDEQLTVARRYIQVQAKRFGYRRPNVDFRKGYIEDLKSAGIDNNSINLVISNCVINLSPDKEKVFSEIFRVLKPGGELYFADVFSGRRVPEEIKKDPILYGECLGGALYIEDFRRLMRKVGFVDCRIVKKRKITLDSPALEAKCGMIDFYSITIRAFKLDGLEDICEDYGQTATYLGTIEGYPHKFAFDQEHIYLTAKPQLICGNSALMLSSTRFSKHFQVSGDCSIHLGPFDCKAAPKSDKHDNSSINSGGCC